MLYANLAEADFSGACLPGASLMGADITQVNFSHADLSFACLNDAKLPRAQMFRTILTDTQMAFTDCSHARLDTLRSRNASFYGAVFDHAVFHEVTLRKARLERTRFRNAKTEGLHISDCTVEKCDFTGTSLAATYPLPPSLFKKAGDWVQSNISGLATFAAGAMLGALLVAPGRSPALAKDASQTAASLPKDQLADFADDAPAWPDVALAQEPFADEDPGLDPATARYLWRFEALVDDHTPGARIEMASYQNEKNCLAGQPCLVRLFTKNAQGVKQEMLGACTSDMSECVMLMEKSAAPAP